jgi:hypothetical protein
MFRICDLLLSTFPSAHQSTEYKRERYAMMVGGVEV